MDCRGFTLIELVAVLVILGVLGFVVTHKLSQNNVELVSISSALENHIRYAQSVGMQADTIIRGIRIDAATDEYWQFNCTAGQSCGWTDNRSAPVGAQSSPALVSPGQNRMDTGQVNVDISQIRVGVSSLSQLTLVYTQFGEPFWIDNTSVVFQTPVSQTTQLTRLTDNITIVLNDSNTNSQTITITGETGFVP